MQRRASPFPSTVPQLLHTYPLHPPHTPARCCLLLYLCLLHPHPTFTCQTFLQDPTPGHLFCGSFPDLPTHIDGNFLCSRNRKQAPLTLSHMFHPVVYPSLSVLQLLCVTSTAHCAWPHGALRELPERMRARYSLVPSCVR